MGMDLTSENSGLAKKQKPLYVVTYNGQLKSFYI